MPHESLREEIAKLQHEQWSGWMEYLFGRCLTPINFHDMTLRGTKVIPESSVLRWERQMNTPYEQLPEGERDSDRVEADKILAILDSYTTTRINEMLDEIEKAMYRKNYGYIAELEDKIAEIRQSLRNDIDKNGS